MQWAYPERLMWLWIMLPAVVVFLWWTARRARAALNTFVDRAVAAELTEQVNWRVRRIKGCLLVASVALVLVASAGPQWGFHWEEVTRRGVDIMIAVDVSKSMLAEDVKPNRLERAKLAIKELLPLLQGDRVGLVAFAGTSFIQCPLTVDYAAFSLTLDTLSTDTIPRGGTALASAIVTSLKAFEHSAQGSRALVLITDGESHEGDPTEAAKAASKAGVKIYAIGIGTAEGELIPVTDDSGRQSFLKDGEGRTVKSRLDEDTLRKAALETGGSYVRATATAFGLDLVYRERISKLEQQEFDSSLRKQYEHRFQWPLALALLLLVIEALLNDKQGSDKSAGAAQSAGRQPGGVRRLAGRFGGRTPEAAKAAAGVICLVLCVGLLGVKPSAAADAAGASAAAAKLYQQGKFDQAIQQLQGALEEAPNDAILHYNLGTASYAKGDYEHAQESLERALAASGPDLLGRIWYNLGNTRYRLGREKESVSPNEAVDQYRQALEAYRMAITQEPDNKKARVNYELVEKRLKSMMKRAEAQGQQAQSAQPQQGQQAESRQGEEQQGAGRQSEAQGQMMQQGTKADESDEGQPGDTGEEKAGETQAGAGEGKAGETGDEEAEAAGSKESDEGKQQALGEASGGQSGGNAEQQGKDVSE